MLRLERDTAADGFGEKRDLDFRGDQPSRPTTALRIAPTADASFIASDHLGNGAGATADLNHGLCWFKHRRYGNAIIAYSQACSNRIRSRVAEIACCAA